MMSGIMLGIAGATAAVAIADTQQAEVDLRFDLQRADHVVVKSEAPRESGFSVEQVELVRHLEPVSSVGEFTIWSDGEDVSRSFGSYIDRSVPIIVADPGGLAATGTSVTSGASNKLLTLRSSPQVAWVGRGLARELGIDAQPTRDGSDAQITVRGIPFSVAGIVQNRDGFGYANRAVVMSRGAAVETLGGAGTNVRLVARVRPGSARAVAHYTVQVVDPDGSLALTDVTPPDGTILARNVATDLRRVGTALGAFLGVLGMVTVANSLMVSVHQRLRELGLRSAIGWSRRRIGSLVLAESAIAGFTAAVLGSALGLAIAASWCWAHRWTLIMPTVLPPLLIACGVAASLVGGLLPALRAASVSPMTVMRS
ncbi:MAG TPA: ABC transporter permease [Marmoricola sp.]|nr:ABC transporter permease [Marmoricola sp.]